MPCGLGFVRKIQACVPPSQGELRGTCQPCFRARELQISCRLFSCLPGSGRSPLHQKFLYGLKPLPSGRFSRDARQCRV
jgi:hypothetical protein